jgi:cytochrome c oxidase subunit I
VAALLLIGTQFIFAFNFTWSLFRGERAPANPWRANSLEWSAPSPPPHGNFATTPIVRRGPYEYSSPFSEEDFLPQDAPPPGPMPEQAPAEPIVTS